MNEECGIFGVFNDPDAAKTTYFGLYALQHRGQESSGISVSDGERMNIYKGMGGVNSVFKDESSFVNLQGKHAIGHNRYSTTGSSSLINAQPILINCNIGRIAAAHNGNIVNAVEIRERMEEEGAIFSSTTDTEIVMHLIARSRHSNMRAKILDATSFLRGAYSLVFLTENALYGVRDPFGVRPLVLGRKNDSWFFSSESCAFDLLDAELVREVEPGEMIRVSDSGVESFYVPSYENGGEKHRKRAQCIFEFVYFSRPDSFIFGQNVDKIRRKLGRRLAEESPVKDADMVMGVPDSATTAALGFSEASGAKYDIGLIRNHYIGRTFIRPAQSSRDLGVKVKFNTVRGVLRNKNVVVVDDSIVRGTTMKKIIELIKHANPKSIHLRISSPPVVSPCYYGIDMPTKDELIANDKNVEEIREYLQVDSVSYLSVEGMLSTLGKKAGDYCTSCFSGEYPIAPAEE